MKLYTVYVKKDDATPLENAKFVQDGGFVIWAGLFQVFWALYKRMWFAASLIFLAQACLVALEKSGYLTPGATIVLRLGFFALLGFSANDWEKADLEYKGYVMVGVVYAGNKFDAKAKFIHSCAG